MVNLVYIAFLCIFLLVFGWLLYNLPILAIGVKHLRKSKRNPESLCLTQTTLPTFSIVIPVKNEEKVIERLLNALAKLIYPSEKIEVIIVEDGSTDKTFEICTSYATKTLLNIKIFRKSLSNGKPSALNYGISHAKGDIIGIFDADSIPASNTLLKVADYFAESDVAAVQGRTFSINSEENMLTKFISYEEAVWCEAYLRGKDALGLFVHLKGCCQFIRRNILEKLNFFDENFLSEDMELSAKLTEKGYKIKYASDVQSWQESPSSLTQLFRQRVRWFRGTMEVAFKYGRLIAKLNKRNIDAEATLIGPFILIASLITYLSAIFCISIPVFQQNVLWQILLQFITIATTLTLFICGLALIFASKPRKISNVLWLPFIYFYWSLQSFIAFYALLLILLGRPQKWLKTEKKGTVKIAASSEGKNYAF